MSQGQFIEVACTYRGIAGIEFVHEALIPRIHAEPHDLLDALQKTFFTLTLARQDELQLGC
jgi:hypothetical protein